MVKANQLAMVDIMQVYTYDIVVKHLEMYLIHALDNNNLFPVYDDSRIIYNDLLKRLDEDIVALNISSKGFLFLKTSSTRVMFLRVAFANSLKLRMAITLADVDGIAAKEFFEQAKGNYLKIKWHLFNTTTTQ
jgi:hypothetical protein